MMKQMEQKRIWRFILRFNAVQITFFGHNFFLRFYSNILKNEKRMSKIMKYLIYLLVFVQRLIVALRQTFCYVFFCSFQFKLIKKLLIFIFPFCRTLLTANIQFKFQIIFAVKKYCKHNKILNTSTSTALFRFNSYYVMFFGSFIYFLSFVFA